MSDGHPIKLNVTPDAFGTTIEIDGKEVQHVRSLGLRAAVDEVTTLDLEYIGVEVIIEGEVAEIRKHGFAQFMRESLWAEQHRRAIRHYRTYVRERLAGAGWYEGPGCLVTSLALTPRQREEIRSMFMAPSSGPAMCRMNPAIWK